MNSAPKLDLLPPLVADLLSDPVTYVDNAFADSWEASWHQFIDQKDRTCQAHGNTGIRGGLSAVDLAMAECALHQHVYAQGSGAILPGKKKMLCTICSNARISISVS